MQPDEVRILKSYLRSRIDDFPALFVSNRNTPIRRVMLHYLMKRYGQEAKLPEEDLFERRPARFETATRCVDIEEQTEFE